MVSDGFQILFSVQYLLLHFKYRKLLLIRRKQKTKNVKIFSEANGATQQSDVIKLSETTNAKIIGETVDLPLDQIGNYQKFRTADSTKLNFKRSKS